MADNDNEPELDAQLREALKQHKEAKVMTAQAAVLRFAVVAVETKGDELTIETPIALREGQRFVVKLVGGKLHAAIEYDEP